MAQLTAAEIAIAFNTQNTRKIWTARANSRPDTGRDMVHFTTTTGIVSLSYNTMDERFYVVFNKYHSTWGDYVKAIARALYMVLNTLKASGLPFGAPTSPAGIEIVVTASDDGTTYVRWEAPPSLATAIMPEQGPLVRIDAMLNDPATYGLPPVDMNDALTGNAS